MYSSRRETGSWDKVNILIISISMLRNSYRVIWDYVVMTYENAFIEFNFFIIGQCVTKRRENFILFRVATMILQYSSIVGYDSLAISFLFFFFSKSTLRLLPWGEWTVGDPKKNKFLGRRISIYGRLFHSQLLQLINYIKSLFNMGPVVIILHVDQLFVQLWDYPVYELARVFKSLKYLF